MPEVNATQEAGDGILCCCFDGAGSTGLGIGAVFRILAMWLTGKRASVSGSEVSTTWDVSGGTLHELDLNPK